MGQALLQTLQVVGWLGIVLAIFLVINTTCGVIYNTNKNGEDFSWKTLFRGIRNAVVFYIGEGLLAIACTILPFINTMVTDTFGIQIFGEQALNNLSTVGVIGTIAYAVISQGTKAFKALKNILGVSANLEQITWEVVDPETEEEQLSI